DEALALYDGPIWGARSRVTLDMIDAAAMLWRLSLRGVALGERWQPLAEAWAPTADAGLYAFNDVHAVMAVVGAGRRDLVRRLLAGQVETMRGEDDNAAFTEEIGRPVTLALLAFGDGHYRECVERL